MNKKEKLNFILETVKKHNITAYEISKNTKLSIFGIKKILDGETKNPNNSTLDSILEFLENTMVGTDYKQDETTNRLVYEHTQTYNTENDINSAQREIINTQKELIETQKNLIQSHKEQVIDKLYKIGILENEIKALKNKSNDL